MKIEKNWSFFKFMLFVLIVADRPNGNPIFGCLTRHQTQPIHLSQRYTLNELNNKVQRIAKALDCCLG